MHTTFLLPQKQGIKIVGYNNMINNPNYNWTPRKKLVFSSIYAKWKKKFVKGEDEKQKMFVIEKPLETKKEIEEKGPLNSNEWGRYAILHHARGIRKLSEKEEVEIRNFEKRIKAERGGELNRQTLPARKNE